MDINKVSASICLMMEHHIKDNLSWMKKMDKERFILTMVIILKEFLIKGKRNMDYINIVMEIYIQGIL